MGIVLQPTASPYPVPGNSAALGEGGGGQVGNTVDAREYHILNYCGGISRKING